MQKFFFYKNMRAKDSCLFYFLHNYFFVTSLTLISQLFLRLLFIKEKLHTYQLEIGAVGETWICLASYSHPGRSKYSNSSATLSQYFTLPQHHSEGGRKCGRHFQRVSSKFRGGEKCSVSDPPGFSFQSKEMS